jgi:hypothetical protein
VCSCLPPIGAVGIVRFLFNLLLAMPEMAVDLEESLPLLQGTSIPANTVTYEKRAKADKRDDETEEQFSHSKM